MSCECKKTCFKDKKKYVKGGKYQLKKKVVNPQKVEEDVNIYPITLMGNIYDEYTGKGLDQVMFMTNHIYLTFEESFACTMKKIPKGFRRLGLYVTIGYPSTKDWLTYVYIGDSTITCEEIQLEKNWRLVEAIDKAEVLGIYESRMKLLEDKYKALKQETDSRIKVKAVTKMQYDNLSYKDMTTLYVITDL